MIMKQAMIGQSDFKNIRKANAYYVDKSLFVEEIMQCPYLTILITRPRRFGKTLNLSLLYHFLEKRDKDESYLFDGLAIKQSKIFQEHFSKYPVIFLTFKDIKDKSFDISLDKIGSLIHEILQQHSYLLSWEKISPVASQLFEKIVNQEAKQQHYENSIKELSKQLAMYHKKPVIILTDEYDTPINAAYANGYYEDMIGFMRNLLGSAYKDNSNLYKGVITGSLRISKESIFTGLNNLGVFTVTKKKFNTNFGFTEQEVKQILEDFKCSDDYEIVKSWYDGYNFGGIKVFNPWSVMNYMADSETHPEPYWLNTSSSDMIEEVLTPVRSTLRRELNDLIEGKVITKTIHENMVFSDINDKRSDLLWSFLLHSGYLKIVKEVKSRFRRKFQLQIPNHEVSIIYFELIEKWIKHHIDLTQLETLLMALTKGDISLFEQSLKTICLEIMSFHDFADAPEKGYHALLLGMLVWLSEDYNIRSNRESGYGRYDIIFKPNDLKKQGIIIEFKVIGKDENADEVLNKALHQIEEKQYDIELKSAGITDVIKIAVGFSGKAVYLKKA